MAGERDLLSKLARSLASFDDAALAAIASAGLVRRAYKDLEKEPITVTAEESGTPVRINIGGEVVTMTESGPATARCTCPAGAKCRHVLVATLYIKREFPLEPAVAAQEQEAADSAIGPCGAGVSPARRPEVESAAADSATASLSRDTVIARGDASAPSTSLTIARDEILGYTWDILAKWVGRKTLREALGLLEGSLDVEVVESGAVTIRFPASSVECRYFPGVGLEGMVTTAPSKSRERFLAAAVLAYQRRHGLVHENDRPAPSALQAASGAPRTRQEILQSARSLLEEMVAIGIAHLSGGARDRLQTLGVSCVGANLPRLALALEALSDEVALTLRRDARADDTRLFVLLARTYALCQALAAAGEPPAPALVGRHRSRYEQTGTLELSGVAAYAWRTQSGYHGLTVLFWDPAARQWCSWSDSRPRTRDRSFDPVARYDQDLPWLGAATGRRMSRMRFKLQGASRNDENRLSTSEQCRAILLDDVDPATIDFGNRLFTDWTDLRRHLASVTPAGLEQHSPLERVVVVRPHGWGPRTFLPAQQTLVWPLLDQQGQSLWLAMPFDEINQKAIDALERIDPALDPPWGIVGRVSFSGTEVRLWPYALFRNEGPLETRIQNLNLDGPGDGDRLVSQAGGSVAVAAGSAEEEPESLTVTAGFAAILKQWAGLEDELQRLAEIGARALVPTAHRRFLAVARDLRDRGLAPLGDGLEPLGLSHPPESIILKMKYLCILYGELASRVMLDVDAPAPAKGRAEVSN